MSSQRFNKVAINQIISRTSGDRTLGETRALATREVATTSLPAKTGVHAVWRISHQPFLGGALTFASSLRPPKRASRRREAGMHGSRLRMSEESLACAFQGERRGLRSPPVRKSRGIPAQARRRRSAPFADAKIELAPQEERVCCPSSTFSKRDGLTPSA
jgi:hypothetical protein